MTVADPVTGAASGLAPGTIVGRYVVVSRLGAGREGVVHTAFDPELARQVALEVARVHGEDDAATRDRDRLLREAQALARLSHRNVVAVYDADVAGELVYLAMELVRGTDLRTWSTHAPRPLDRIIEVLAEAGEGLGAAHRLGLVHGDFAAEHVRVGDDGRVCVAFGLARRREIEATADQHAWCIAAFEAIYGTRATAGARPPSVAAAPLAQRVPRWLRSILARGLAAAPADRFGSMDALLAALARGRRRRRRIAVAAVGVGAVLIVASTSLRDPPATACPVPTPDGWDDFDPGAVQRSFVAARPSYGAPLATWVTGRIEGTRTDWRRIHGEICEATWVRGEQSALLLDARMACMRRAWDRIAATTTTLELADADVVEHAIELVADLPRPEQCQTETPPADASIDVAPSPARRAVEQGLAEVHARRRIDRDAEAARALDRLDPLVVELGDPRLRIEVMLLRGRMLDDRGEPEAALETLHEAAVWAKSIDAPLLEAEAWIALANAVGYTAHDFDEGRFYGGLALAAIERGGGGDQLRSWAETALGTIEFVAGDDERAQAMWQSALDRRVALLGEPHHLVAASLNNLGGVAYARGENDRAGELLGRAMAMREELFGPEHPSVAESAINLALVRTVQGRLDDAVALAERAIRMQRSANGDEHPNTGRGHDALAGALEAKGDHAAALHHAETALAIYAKAYGAEHPASRNVALHRARALVGLSRTAEARPILQALAVSLEDGSDPQLADTVRRELAALGP